MTDIEEPDRLPGAPHPRETAVLYGQAAAEAAFLEAAATGRLHHAWAITGPRGVGKATLAWRIARHLIAGEAGPTLDMAPDHPVFRQVAALAAPQLFLCRRPWDDKAERLRTAITVDEVRALKAFFQLSAADGGWRVAIVDAADELNGAAANALLKILEEPPANAVLLLVCHRPAALLPTLRSRCRELRCRPLDAAALAARPRRRRRRPGPRRRHPPGRARRRLGRRRAPARSPTTASPSTPRSSTCSAPPRSTAAAPSRWPRPPPAATPPPATRLTLDLIRLALARLALAGAGAAVTPVSDAEAALMARLGRTAGPGPALGRRWFPSSSTAPRTPARSTLTLPR